MKVTPEKRQDAVMYDALRWEQEASCCKIDDVDVQIVRPLPAALPQVYTIKRTPNGSHSNKMHKTRFLSARLGSD